MSFKWGCFRKVVRYYSNPATFPQDTAWSINTSTSMLYLPVRSNFCSVCQHQLDSLITILVKQTKNLNYYLKGSVHMSQVYTIFIKM